MDAKEKEKCAARKADVLPINLPPRGLSRAQAAAYIGVSPSHLDELIRSGLVPRPKRLGRRVVWDRNQLDAALDALPNDGEEARADDVWARCAV